MSEICITKNDDYITANTITEMSQVDRRKRKSCEKPTGDVKRSRISTSYENENQSKSAFEQSKDFDQSQIESPKSEDCSSSTTSTSGVDVTDSNGSGQSAGCVGGSVTQGPDQSQVVNISNFVRFQPVDPTVPRKLKSSLKKRSRQVSSPTQNGLDSPTMSSVVQAEKETKKSVHFNVVREFRFNRIQSFVSMPSYGGLSLGMEKGHHGGRELVLDRYRVERERSRRRKMRRWRKKQQVDVVTNSSSESDSESEDECVSGGSLHLQPVLPERRRRLLARSGFKIENDSVLIDNNIRQQRELCGCDCQGICYPETCACHSNGIGCQVDRLSFPCGCARNQCWNSFGRTSFNVERVKDHFYKTMTRLRQPDSTSLPIPIGQEVKNSQKFSFGDFTLPPDGDPPSREQYQMAHHMNHHAWNGHQHPNIYWHDWGHYNFNQTAHNNSRQVQYNDPYGLGTEQFQNHFQYQNSFDESPVVSTDSYFNQSQLQQDSPNCHDNISNSVQSVFTANTATAESAIVTTATSKTATVSTCSFSVGNHSTDSADIDSAVGSGSQSGSMSSDYHENERLSESSESGIGEESNTESTNSSPNVPISISMNGSIETSITIAYNDDSNASLPVPVGSE